MATLGEYVATSEDNSDRERCRSANAQSSPMGHGEVRNCLERTTMASLQDCVASLMKVGKLCAREKTMVLNVEEDGVAKACEDSMLDMNHLHSLLIWSVTL
jgi:hypothetical protein